MEILDRPPSCWAEGARLFENLGDAGLELSQVQAIDAPGVVHVTYAVGNGSG